MHELRVYIAVELQTTNAGLNIWPVQGFHPVDALYKIDEPIAALSRDGLIYGLAYAPVDKNEIGVDDLAFVVVGGRLFKGFGGVVWGHKG